jgi:integrase/recombinase XerD
MTLPVPLIGELVTRTPLEDFAAFTDRWLENQRFAETTREAYRRDVLEYLGWCHARDLHPLEVTFIHVNTYGRDLENNPSAWTGKPLGARTVARKMAAISSWYAFLEAADAIRKNPAKAASRPRIDREDTKTIGFTEGEASAMVRAARDDPWLAPGGGYLLARFMVDMGARVSEVCAVDLEDFGYSSGHRTVRLERMKGGKSRERAVPPALAAGLEIYLTARTELEGQEPETGPLFVRPDGGRINRQEVLRFVRRIARAGGLSSADRITPHSFRHGWNTIARERGATLEARQFAMGHADARTTQGYDRSRKNLENDPSYLVAAAVGG